MAFRSKLKKEITAEELAAATEAAGIFQKITTAEKRAQETAAKQIGDKINLEENLIRQKELVNA